MESNPDTDTAEGCCLTSDDSSGFKSDLLDGKEEEQTLRNQVAENPYNYDAHMALIELIGESGDVEALRGVRENMSAVFPLTPELWIQWINEEKDISAPDYVRQLYERAVKDYLSPDIWQDYAEWSMVALSDEYLNVSEVRFIFEQSLVSVGVHFTRGCLLWDEYRIFETGLEQASDDPDFKEEQRQRLNKIFRRQLALPLSGIENVWQEYVDFLEGAEPDPAVLAAYNAAKDRVEQIKPFEDDLEAAESPRLKQYSAYIDFEQKTKDPVRIQLIFERAIVENCLNEKLWMRYLTWLDKHLRVHEIILPIYARAVRNCSWAPGIWQRYLLALERADKDWSEIEDTFSKAVASGFSNSGEGVQLWLNFVYMVRRREKNLAEKSGKVIDTDAIEAQFVRGEKFLRETFGDRHWDPDCYYQKSWAYFQVSQRKDLDSARKLWENIMASGNGSFATMWLEFLNLEREYGSADKVSRCRKLLFHAVNSVVDNPQAVCHALLQFEREEGTLADLDNASHKVEARLGQLAEQAKNRKQKFREKKQAENYKRHSQKDDHENTRAKPDSSIESKFMKKGKKEEKKVSGDSKLREKRKREEVKVEPEKTVVDQDGFAVPSAIPPAAKKARMVERLPDTKRPKMECAQSSVSVSSKADSSTEASKTAKIDTSRYDKTVFVSNLDFSVDEDHLHSIFSPLGEIAEVRLVKHQSGKSKGFGFVEFKSVEPVQKALQLDRNTIDERPMYVSPCEDKSKNPTRFMYGTGLQKNKLFLKHLAEGVSEEDLRNIFSPHGELKQVRLVTNRQGKSRGCAYIEFEDENSASRALEKTENLEIRGKKISVSFSNPPAREKQESSVGNFSGRIPHSSKIMLTPRSLTTSTQQVPKKAVSANSEQENGSEGPSISATKQQAKLSNAQFREIYLKK